MTVASAPPYPDRVTIQQVMPTGSTHNDSPPAYEESANPSSMPPTYESLYGEFRQVEDPKGLAQFLAKAFAMIISTMTAAVLLAVLNIIPLGMISATNFCYRAKRQREGRPPSAADVNPNPFDDIIIVFNTLIKDYITNQVGISMSDGNHYHVDVGSVWVYSVYDDVQYSSPRDNNYCDQFTYIFSFVFVTLGYVLLACTLCCFCCCCCCICCRPKNGMLVVLYKYYYYYESCGISL
ncbi:hypothetical protein DINM_001581 [Dirofilaria immitis]|nr:hypothetical protein [Dirofilaria immitis]